MKSTIPVAFLSASLLQLPARSAVFTFVLTTLQTLFLFSSLHPQSFFFQPY